VYDQIRDELKLKNDLSQQSLKRMDEDDYYGGGYDTSISSEDERQRQTQHNVRRKPARYQSSERPSHAIDEVYIEDLPARQQARTHRQDADRLSQEREDREYFAQLDLLQTMAQRRHDRDRDASPRTLVRQNNGLDQADRSQGPRPRIVVPPVAGERALTQQTPMDMEDGEVMSSDSETTVSRQRPLSTRNASFTERHYLPAEGGGNPHRGRQRVRIGEPTRDRQGTPSRRNVATRGKPFHPNTAGARPWDTSRWLFGHRGTPTNHDQDVTYGVTPRRSDFMQREEAHSSSHQPRTTFDPLHISERRDFPHSSRAYSKTVKSQPFPSDIKASDKLYRWSIWANVFRMGLERAGITGQRDRAMELSLAAGDEVNAIILTEGLLPEVEDVDEGFKFFDFMMSGITAAFERMTDTSVTAREFTNTRQNEGESANDYAMRVRINARKLNLNHETLITSVFIGGLIDADVRRWCNNLRHSMEEALVVATRSENDPSYRQGLVHDQGHNAPLAVAAVGTSAQGPPNPQHSKKDKQRTKRGRSPDAKQVSKKPNNNKSEGGSGACRHCGRLSHRDRPCPALNAQCHICQRVGHFSAVCRDTRVRTIKGKSGDDKVNDEVYD
jgi:hypothetical protein